MKGFMNIKIWKGTHSFKVRIEKSDTHSHKKTRRIFNKLFSEQPAIQKHMNLFACPVHGDTICLIAFLGASIEQLWRRIIVVAL